MRAARPSQAEAEAGFVAQPPAQADPQMLELVQKLRNVLAERPDEEDLPGFPDAFAGTMAQLLCALEDKTEPEISGADNLKTMALVEACYRSAKEHRAVDLAEILGRKR